MSNKVYDFLKWFALIALPALTTFYGVVGATLNLPCTQEIVTIAIAADTCLGAMLGISSSNYNKEKKKKNPMKYNDILYHHGVKGMHWGIRRKNLVEKFSLYRGHQKHRTLTLDISERLCPRGFVKNLGRLLKPR